MVFAKTKHFLFCDIPQGPLPAFCPALQKKGSLKDQRVPKVKLPRLHLSIMHRIESQPIIFWGISIEALMKMQLSRM